MGVIRYKSHEILVDDEDVDMVLPYKWYVSITSDGHKYAKNINKRKSLFLHRLIMNAQKGQIVDHKNGNTLDNRKENLRIVSSSENCGNSKEMNNKRHSKYKGVSYFLAGSRSKRWTAKVQYQKKGFHLGYFATEQEAFEAYKTKHIELFKEHSYFNRESL